MKHKYSDLIKKHDLPDVREWVIVDDEITIQDIRKAFQEKLYGFADILDILLHPEGVPSMMEAQVFSDDEHKKMDEFYNKVMLLGKDCMLVDIAATEAEEVSFIKKLCKELPSLTSELKQIVEKTKDAYNGKSFASHNVSYLG